MRKLIRSAIVVILFSQSSIFGVQAHQSNFTKNLIESKKTESQYELLPTLNLSREITEVINRAKKLAIKKLVIKLKPGKYKLGSPLNISLAKGELESLEIVGNGDVLVEGGANIVMTKMDESGLAQADLDTCKDLNAIAVNGEKLWRAVYPNKGSPAIPIEATLDIVPGQENDVNRPQKRIFKISEKEFSDLFNSQSARKKIIALIDQEWEEHRSIVRPSEEYVGRLVISTPLRRNFLRLSPIQAVRFEGDPGFVDEFGEYAVDASTCRIYVKAHAGTSPVVLYYTNDVSSIKVVGDGEESNLKISGIEFNSFSVPNELIESHKSEQAAVDVPAFINIINIKHLQIHNNVFKNIYKTALQGVANNGLYEVIENNFSNIGGSAIRLGSFERNGEVGIFEVNVKSNKISDAGILFPGAPSIVVGLAGGGYIENNRIRNSAGAAISVGWTWGYSRGKTSKYHVKSNIISNTGDGRVRDIGAIYILSGTSGTFISDNVICGVRGFKKIGEEKAWGIYLDEGVEDVLLSRNLIYKSKSGDIHLHYGRNNVSLNNYYMSEDALTFNITRKQSVLGLTSVGDLVPRGFVRNSIASADLKVVHLKEYNILQKRKILYSIIGDKYSLEEEMRVCFFE